MSDLLPLVAATLRDKVVSDALEEINALKKQLDVSRRVEIIRAKANGDDEDEDEDVVVYASGRLQDGRYGANPNLWQIDLKHGKDESSSMPFRCRLADLRDCHICVGGGFPMATLDDALPNNAPMEGWLENESDGEFATALVCFCPHATWLTFAIHGWPKREWEVVAQQRSYDSDAIISYLVETVASAYPEATVEFVEVSFVANVIGGGLKRLLPAKRREEVRLEREERQREEESDENFQAWRVLHTFVATTMREFGNEATHSHFLLQVDEVVGFLNSIGIHERSEENDQVITHIVSLYESAGAQGFSLYEASIMAD